MLLRLILTAGATALPNWHLDARPPWEAVLASWDRESNFSRPRPMLNPLVDSWDDVLGGSHFYDGPLVVRRPPPHAVDASLNRKNS